MNCDTVSHPDRIRFIGQRVLRRTQGYTLVPRWTGCPRHSSTVHVIELLDKEKSYLANDHDVIRM